jgi:predicted DNA-binding protein
MKYKNSLIGILGLCCISACSSIVPAKQNVAQVDVKFILAKEESGVLHDIKNIGHYSIRLDSESKNIFNNLAESKYTNYYPSETFVVKPREMEIDYKLSANAVAPSYYKLNLNLLEASPAETLNIRLSSQVSFLTSKDQAGLALLLPSTSTSVLIKEVKLTKNIPYNLTAATVNYNTLFHQLDAESELIINRDDKLDAKLIYVLTYQ